MMMALAIPKYYLDDSYAYVPLLQDDSSDDNSDPEDSTEPQSWIKEISLGSEKLWQEESSASASGSVMEKTIDVSWTGILKQLNNIMKFNDNNVASVEVSQILMSLASSSTPGGSSKSPIVPPSEELFRKMKEDHEIEVANLKSNHCAEIQEHRAHIEKQLKKNHQVEMGQLKSRLEKEHAKQVEKIMKAHKTEVDGLKICLDEIQALKKEAERQAKEDRKSLNEVCRQKNFEIKMIREENEKRASEVKWSSQKIVGDLCTLYRSIDQLGKEKNQALTDRDAWANEAEFYKEKLEKAQRTIEHQSCRIRNLQDALGKYKGQ